MLHPERKVDVILNMDASSDVQKDSFNQRVQQIGSRRGLDFKRRHDDVKPNPDPADPDRFRGLYGQIYDGTPAPRPATVVDSYGKTVQNPPAAVVTRECTMVYLPLLPNERAVPGYDPSTAKFSGSYNLVWTPEQIDMCVGCAGANFREAEGAVKEALGNAWQRNKRLRESGQTGTAAGAAPVEETASASVSVVRQDGQALGQGKSAAPEYGHTQPVAAPTQGLPNVSAQPAPGAQGQYTLPPPPPGPPPSQSGYLAQSAQAPSGPPTTHEAYMPPTISRPQGPPSPSFPPPPGQPQFGITGESPGLAPYSQRPGSSYRPPSQGSYSPAPAQSQLYFPPPPGQ